MWFGYGNEEFKFTVEYLLSFLRRRDVSATEEAVVLRERLATTAAARVRVAFDVGTFESSSERHLNAADA